MFCSKDRLAQWTEHFKKMIAPAPSVLLWHKLCWGGGAGGGGGKGGKTKTKIEYFACFTIYDYI